jgi:hypothetical protein
MKADKALSQSDILGIGCSDEIWKPIPGWEGYYSASSYGRVRSETRDIPHPRNPTIMTTKKGLVLSPKIKNGGYHGYCFSRDSKNTHVSGHRVICAAFHGAPKPGMHAAHNDGNPGNNRPDNLRWATPQQNFSDRQFHGTLPIRSRNPNARLTQDQVNEIRARRGPSRAKLAAEFGVSPSQIGNIQSGRSWQTDDVIDTSYFKENMRNRVAKITWDDVRQIRAEPNTPARELAERYGVSASNIGAIRRGVSWRE